ncbi:MAG: hypothetical protein WKF37_13645 [Bryobacteraceae bacterium]
MMTTEGLRLVVVGSFRGLIAACAATLSFQTLLFGLRAVDPVTYELVSLAVIVIALMAYIVPAWRAARVDPLIALRQE